MLQPRAPDFVAADSENPEILERFQLCQVGVGRGNDLEASSTASENMGSKAIPSLSFPRGEVDIVTTTPGPGAASRIRRKGPSSSRNASSRVAAGLAMSVAWSAAIGFVPLGVWSAQGRYRRESQNDFRGCSHCHPLFSSLRTDWHCSPVRSAVQQRCRSRTSAARPSMQWASGSPESGCRTSDRTIFRTSVLIAAKRAMNRRRLPATSSSALLLRRRASL